MGLLLRRGGVRASGHVVDVRAAGAHAARGAHARAGKGGVVVVSALLRSVGTVQSLSRDMIEARFC